MTLALASARVRTLAFKQTSSSTPTIPDISYAATEGHTGNTDPGDGCCSGTSFSGGGCNSGVSCRGSSIGNGHSNGVGGSCKESDTSSILAPLAGSTEI